MNQRAKFGWMGWQAGLFTGVAITALLWNPFSLVVWMICVAIAANLLFLEKLR